MKRLSVLFLSAFAVLTGGMFAYDAIVVAPGDRCEAQGMWWDAQGRECAKPISIAEITGRPLPGARALASEQKNRELLAIEDSLAAQQKARDADAARQRAALAAQ
ncbi:MAG TPA: hypothetical protein VFF48_04785 [Brevundimonas sp.]|nr:hypothetical protein [Brevundimonas sp.]